MELLVPLAVVGIVYLAIRFWMWVFRSVNDIRGSLKQIAAQGGAQPTPKNLMKPVGGAKREAR